MNKPENKSTYSRVKLRGLILISILLILFSFRFQHSMLDIFAAYGMTVGDETQPDQELIDAIQEAIQMESESVLGYLIYDITIENFQFSDDGSTGTAWLIYNDPDTGQPIPTEPGLVIFSKVNDLWEVSLPSAVDWYDSLLRLPEDVMKTQDLSHWQELYQDEIKTTDLGPYAGYLLPWRPNLEIILTRSITHYNPPNPNGDMHYSFDFAHPWVSGGSPMFELIAAKSGRVHYARWTQPNGSEDSPGNYLVVEDISTEPPTYMLYLHLAQDSIPEELRVKGAQVTQGQYIGLADDTGYSTGNHLHFQVHTYPLSYWGKSVDIIFEDVDMNGGRPRQCIEAINYPEYGAECQSGDRFTSENYYLGDRTPPTGDIITPAPGQIQTNPTVTIQGTAQDNLTGLKSAKILANYSGDWHTISPEYSTPNFEYQWDMCAAGVPDGPVALYLLLVDVAGNINYDYPGFRYFTKQASCDTPPVSCVPETGDIAIFDEENYAGACKVLDLGDFPSSYYFSPVLDNQISSIKLGDLTQVTLYSSSSYSGRKEILAHSDPNLLDNRIGSNTISSMRVGIISTPDIPSQVYPQDNDVLTDVDSIDLTVSPSSGNQEFQFELISSTKSTRSAWTDSLTWNIGSLEPNQYQWRVRARNDEFTGDWSEYIDFDIAHQETSLSAVVAPVTYSIEETTEGWTHDDGWALVDDDNDALSPSRFWQYTTDRTSYDGFGDLTTPLITIPITTTKMAVEFWYKYDTENSFQHWDKRWLQLSINGDPFTNTLQLTGDPEYFWMKVSAPLELDTSITNTIQARFHFNTVDDIDNTHTGWFIDEFSVVPISSDPCSFSPSDNVSFAHARLINYGETLTQEICPSGDMDFYKFSGQENDQVVIDVDTPDTSELDGMVFLYDNDLSLVTSDDDEVPYELLDPLLTTTLPKDGTYYFYIQPWDKYQGTGVYSIQLRKDNTAPQITATYPPNNSSFFSLPITLTLDVADDSGVKSIQYFWHNSDWENNDWELIAIEEGPGDFSTEFNPLELTSSDQIDFYAIVTDLFGNWTATREWRSHYLIVTDQIFMPSIFR